MIRSKMESQIKNVSTVKNTDVQLCKDTISNLGDIKKAHHNKWACLLCFDISDFKNVFVIV